MCRPVLTTVPGQRSRSIGVVNVRIRSTTVVMSLATVATLALAGCAGDGDGSVPAAQERGAAATMPPWPAPVDDVPGLVEAAGLDLGPMGTAEHYHPTLSIVVDGEQVLIPPNIGVDPSTGAMSAVHTHESDGTIHIEADTVGETFTLGQLFTQWNVPLSEDQIGGVTTDNGVSVTVNGRRVAGNPAELQLRPEQRIVLDVS